MAKRSKDKDRREKSKERKKITLEMKVRAIKLLMVDKYKPEDVLQDLENSFGLKVADSAWENAEQFLQRIQNNLKSLICKEGPHTQHLLKLLTQAELISLTGGKDEFSE